MMETAAVACLRRGVAVALRKAPDPVDRAQRMASLATGALTASAGKWTTGT